MTIGLPPGHPACGLDPAALSAIGPGDGWGRSGVSWPDRPRPGRDADDSLVALAGQIKADLRGRFARGERPAVSEYLDRFPGLRDAHDRMVSLVYEEYCLREEYGERVDPEQFCDRYRPWRDSLASQLRYHRLLSQVVGPPAAPPRFPEPGERFQGFELRTVLGQGGVARVYLASDPSLGDREVALKVAPDRGKEPSIQGKLDHAHIVPVLSVTPPDPETGLRGLCMPYRSGSPLDEVIRWVDPASRPRRARVLWDALATRGRAEWETGPRESGWRGFPERGPYADGVAWVALGLARALEHAHSRGILHRDVKPANVLLTFRGGPQLLDFNLAHDPHAAERAEAALRGGTLPYMAPEQLEAFLDPARWEGVGDAADLYALGLLVCELLVGRRPELPDSGLPLPRAIRELLDRRAAPRPSLRLLNPAIPHALDAIVARCLAFRPADRYRGAGELADDLQRFLEHRPLRHTPNPSKAEVARNFARRNRVAISLAFGALVAAPIASYALSEGARYAPIRVRIGEEYRLNNKLDRADEEFELARILDPTLFTPYQGKGEVAFQRGDYEGSISFMDEAIERAERTTPRPHYKQLAYLYQSRAAPSLRLGDEIQRGLTVKALLAAASRYDAALRDLDRARRLAERYDAALRDLDRARRLADNDGRDFLFRIEYGAASAEKGLGDIASKFRKYQESTGHYTRALAFLDRALRLHVHDDVAHQLKLELEGRIGVDRAELERSHRPDPGRDGRRAGSPAGAPLAGESGGEASGSGRS